RSVADNSGLYCACAQHRRIRGGSLHYSGVLVHSIHIVCQSRRHFGSLAVRYLCRYRASRRCRIHLGAVGGNDCGGAPWSMALERLNVCFGPIADLATSLSRDAFDVRQLPQLVEKRLVGSVETKRREPCLAVCCRDPVVLLSSRSLGGEVDID